MLEDLDAAIYIRFPMTDVSTGITLAMKLGAAAPKKAPAQVKNAKQKVMNDLTPLQAAVAARARGGREDVRPAWNAITNAWSIMQDRLAACSHLPLQRYPLAARAAELMAIFFADGLLFTRTDVDKCYVESNHRIERIAADHLADDLDRIAGPEYRAELLHAHEEFGRALGVTRPREGDAPPPDLRDLLATLLKSISNYALQLVAWHNDGGEDVRAPARAALRPLDDHRATHARRPAASAGAPANTNEDETKLAANADHNDSATTAHTNSTANGATPPHEAEAPH